MSMGPEFWEDPLALKRSIDPSITVSVSIVTYNQKAFIKQAIDGVIQQKVDFNIEIIIGDDFSTDGTREILMEYQQKYPDLIKLILHSKKNDGVPGKINFLSTISTCRGKYIALLDGDDYWTDPYKLKKQVEFLDKNPDYSICFHRIEYLRDNKIEGVSNWDTDNTYKAEDLAKGNFIFVPSVVFRNGLFKKFPDWFLDATVGDFVVHMLNAKHGKLRYLAEPMAVYRLHNSSFWQARSQKDQNEKFSRVIELLFNEFPDAPQVVDNLKYQYAIYMATIADIYYKENDLDNYQIYLKKAFDISSSFMKEWLVTMKSDYERVANSKAFKIGSSITNNSFLQRFYRLVKSK